MQHNHPLIANAYHFLCEAIIIFLVFLPVLHHKYFFVPYWSYLGICILACGIFTVLTKFKVNILVNLFVAPVLFIAFTYLDYPTVMSIIFSGLLVWRYMNIRKQKFIKRESLYILITIIVTVYVSILVHDSHIMLFPFLQFVILFFGYISSHLVHVLKRDRKQIDRKVPALFVGLLLLGAGLLYLSYPLLYIATTTIWNGIITLVGGTILGISDLLSFFQVEQRPWPEQTPEEAKHGDGYWLEELGDNVVEEMTGLLAFAVVVLILFVLILLGIGFLRKRVKNLLREEERELSNKESPVMVISDNFTSQENQPLFKRIFRAPEHPIRKLVFQFEKKAAKYKKGRRPHETIEEWFDRIGIDANITIYQNVRYGDGTVSEQDEETLRKQLEVMEKALQAK